MLGFKITQLWLAISLTTLYFIPCYGKSIRVVVYIGPYRTSNIHMHKTLFHNVKTLRTHSYTFPGKCTSSHRSLVSFLMGNSTFEGEDILANVPEYCRFKRGEIQSFFNEKRAKQKNIILSSDYFSLFDEKGVQKLRDLTEGFEVTIVMSYRIWVSRILSTLQDKAATLNWPLRTFFGDYIFLFIGKNYWGNTVQKLRDLYGNVFGYSNVRVIDYLGSRNTGKNTFEILLCDVMKFYRTCDEDGRFLKNFRVEQDPPYLRIQQYQMLHLFIQYAYSYHCYIPKENYHIILYKNWGPNVPKNKKHVSNFVDSSISMDNALRKRVKLMHGNETTNHFEAYSAHLAQVDRNYVAVSKEWRARFQRFLNSLKNHQLAICNNRNRTTIVDY